MSLLPAASSTTIIHPTRSPSPTPTMGTGSALPTDPIQPSGTLLSSNTIVNISRNRMSSSSIIHRTSLPSPSNGLQNGKSSSSTLLPLRFIIILLITIVLGIF